MRDLASGHEVQLKGAPRQVYGAVFSPDGRYVLAAPDSDPIVWRVDRPDAVLAQLKGHRGPVNEISIGRGDRMLTAGSDGTVRMWDPSGRQLAVMRGNEDELTTAIFTTDGTQVLSSGQDGSLRLFDADSGSSSRCCSPRPALRRRAEPRRHGRDARDQARSCACSAAISAAASTACARSRSHARRGSSRGVSGSSS